MTTFKQFLVEGSNLKNGYYQLPHNATRRDKGIAQLYNQIIPDLSKQLGIPSRNFLVTGWSIENAVLYIKIISSKADLDMLKLMLPLALKAELEKTFKNVQVIGPVVSSTKATAKGTVYPQLIMQFRASYPQKWIEWDKRDWAA